MENILKKYLLDNWDKFEMGKKPEDLILSKFAERGIRAPEVSIITYLATGLTRGKETPLLILRTPKLATNPQALASLETEFNNLTAILKELRDKKILKTIPAPIFLENIHSLRVLCMAFLAGQPLSKKMISENILKTTAANFQLAFGWLSGFQKKLGAAEKAAAAEVAARVIGTYERSFPKKPARAQYFSKIRKLAEQFPAKDIPVLAQHADFHAENVFLEQGRVSGVIDWEDFDVRGVPAFDLYHFIYTYFEALFATFSHAGNADLLEMFSAGEPVIKAVRSVVREYFQEMGLRPELAQVLVPLYLAHSVCLAGSPRKQAQHAMKKLEILLELCPLSLADLLLAMTVFNWSALAKKAQADGDQKLAQYCAAKKNEILKQAELRKSS
ncbi:aminoglycoside phosphotransferase family protein [Candidatus Margulisiibacteriota bacterium]